MLQAALENQVKRVVVTSSGTAVLQPNALTNKTYSEKDWVSPEEARHPYQKSKVLAEKAAWDFYEKHKNEPNCFEMSVVIPVFVLGPPLSSFNGSSIARFITLFDKKVDKVDNNVTAVCDVRDVALAHIRASQVKEAVGERIWVLSSTKPVTSVDLANVLKEAGYDVNRVEDKSDKSTYEKTVFDDSKLRNLLKVEPFDLKETILDTAESLVEFGLIKV